MSKCDMCGGDEATESIEKQWIDYMAHDRIGRISVMVPVITCHNTKTRWTDYRAEEIREKAVRDTTQP